MTAQRAQRVRQTVLGREVATLDHLIWRHRHSWDMFRWLDRHGGARQSVAPAREQVAALLTRRQQVAEQRQQEARIVAALSVVSGGGCVEVILKASTTPRATCTYMYIHVHVQMGPAYFTQSTSYFRVFIAEISRLTNTKICGPARIFKTFITSLP